MASAITVRADIVDIRSARSAPDHIFVDTNVWFWYAYGRSILAAPEWRRRQIAFYSTFLQKVIQSRSELYHSGLQLAELFHQIEKAELDDFNYRTNSQLKLKNFRHEQPAERQQVVDQCLMAWVEVTKVSKPIDCIIEATMTKAALDRFSAQPLDGYDIFFVESLIRSGVTTNVLTDDGDFATVPGITVYTANDRVI